MIYNFPIQTVANGKFLPVTGAKGVRDDFGQVDLETPKNFGIPCDPFRQFGRACRSRHFRLLLTWAEPYGLTGKE